ncbi:MAG: hypothetical protein HYR94_05715 [Chloroflexi bacterium]|nr:hypothetical protein [Chloroflexota bacterium]
MNSNPHQFSEFVVKNTESVYVGVQVTAQVQRTFLGCYRHMTDVKVRRTSEAEQLRVQNAFCTPFRLVCDLDYD